MKFVSILDEALLLEHISGNDRSAVYKTMLEELTFQTDPELELDIPSVVEEMIQHEMAAGTMIPGVAMPHLRVNSLHDLFIIIGLPENPAATDAQVVFMSLIGNDMSDVYLKMISTLARHLMNQENMNAFQAAAAAGKDSLWNYLQTCNMVLRNVVTAEDVMSTADVFLTEDAPLSQAFDMFNSTHRRFLPVVDAQGCMVGELSAREVVKSFFPEYVFMMGNLNFLNDFAVFNEIFHSEHAIPVSQYMNTEPPVVTLETPLIQLTLLLTKQDAGDVYIVDGDKKLKGVFSIENVISKVLRG